MPKTVRELRGTGYYIKLMADYSTIMWLLTEQLKKGAFNWNEVAHEAFVRLKEALTTTLVLALPDFTTPFVVEVDASGYGLGAVLMQNNRLIAFYGYILSTRARLKSIYERELMAILFAMQC